MKKIRLLALLLLVTKICLSQNYTVVKNDYKKWLDRIELSQFFEVYAIKEKAGFKILQLQLNYESADSAKILWKSFLSEFKSTHSKYSLEEFLFFQYLHTIKLNPDEIAVKIQDTFEQNKTTCVKILIYYDKDSRKIKSKQSLCMTQTDDFSISFDKIDVGSTEINLDNTEQNRHELFSSIIQFTKNFYKKGGFEKDRHTKKAKFMCNYKEGEEKLVMKIYELKNEVLRDRGQSYLCRALQWWYEDEKYCDYRAWEYLQITIQYNTFSNSKAKIICSIDGKFSSGYYEPTIWGRANEMEPQFTPYLMPYTENFTDEIYRFIKK